jgi:hypothetical protein
MRQEAHRHLLAEQWADLLLGVAADGCAGAHDQRRLVQHLTLGFLGGDLARQQRGHG